MSNGTYELSKVDKYMEVYFTKFKGSSFVEKPKGLQSLA